MEQTKCVIRRWRPEDAESLAAALNDRAVLDNLRDGLPFPYRPEDALWYINAMLSADPHGTFAYAVDVGGKAVGSVGAFRQENIHARTAELGYYLGREYWGHGIMTAAVRQLCAKLFAETDLLRIYAEPFTSNTGSRRVLEKSGFRLEGILRQNAVKNGKVQDMAMYSLLREDAALMGEDANSAAVPDIPDTVRLGTRRLTVEPMRPEEIAGLAERCRAADPELSAAYGEMLAGCLAHPKDALWYTAWRFRLRGTDVQAGDACFKGLSADGRAEIGYGIEPEHQGKGYATEGVRALCRWAFSQPGVCLLEAETLADNRASQRVLEKLGFRPNGEVGEEGPRWSLDRASFDAACRA